MTLGRVRLPAFAMAAAALSACSGGGGAMPPGPRPSQAAATPMPSATAAVAATSSPAAIATATTGPVAPTPMPSASQIAFAPVAFVPHVMFGCDVFAPPMFPPNGVICHNGGDGSFEFSSFLELYDTNAATAVRPMLTVDQYHGNPGAFAAPGTVFAAAQYTLDETPAALTATTIDLELGYQLSSFYDPAAVGVPGAKFTCTMYDGSERIGSASAVVPSSTRQQPNDSIGCTGVSGIRLRPASDPSTAVVTLPSTFYANRTYTALLSF